MWSVCLCVHTWRLHTWKLHTLVVLLGGGENQLQREEAHQIQPVVSAPLCSADPSWSFQVVHKLAHDNSCLHRNYNLLTACAFTCVSAVYVYNAWTRLEPLARSSGLWFGIWLCVCAPECRVRSLIIETNYYCSKEADISRLTFMCV